MNLFYIVLLLLLLLSILFIWYIGRKNTKSNKIKNPDLTIAITACNRYEYLNQTLNSLFTHIQKYEKQLYFIILYFDQGTVERYDIIKKYDIKNSFLFNPSGMELSFDTLFSYIYSEYVFMLEEDWVVEKNIENEIFYPAFIMESLLILSAVDKIYGVILRETHDFEIYENLTVRTKMGNDILYIGFLWLKYAYTNGASIYRTKELKVLDRYKGEGEVSNIFLYKGYKVGFTYKGRKGKKDDIYYQHVMDHIGLNTSRSSICSVALY